MKASVEQYRIFHTVAVYGNISRAADMLYISQPAVSKTIQKLEVVTGVKLFSRSSRGVKLTSEGQVLFEYVDRSIKELSAGERVMDRLVKKEQGLIRIGVSTTLCRYLLIPYLKQFIDKHPKIQIQITNKTTFDTLGLLNEGQIDFGIVSRPFQLNNLNFLKLMDVQDIFVIGRNYSGYDTSGKLEDIISHCPIMLMESNNITRQYIDQYFIDNNILRQPEIEISSMDFLIEFAKIGLGAAAVIKEFVLPELQQGELIEIPLKKLPPIRPVGIVSHSRIPMSIAAQTFINYLKSEIDACFG